MANPLLLGLGGAFAGISMLDSIFGNKKIKKQAEASKMAETIRSSERKDEQAKLGAANAGIIRASSADRRTYGRSSQAAALAQLIKAATNESAIESDRSMRIMQIAAEASRNRTNPLAAGVSGFSTGVSFGKNLQDLLE